MNKKLIPYPQGVRVLKLPAGALSSRTDERLETILMRQENPRIPFSPQLPDGITVYQESRCTFLPGGGKASSSKSTSSAVSLMDKLR